MRLAAEVTGAGLRVELLLGRGLAAAQAVDGGIGRDPVEHGERRGLVGECAASGDVACERLLDEVARFLAVADDARTAPMQGRCMAFVQLGEVIAFPTGRSHRPCHARRTSYRLWEG